MRPSISRITPFTTAAAFSELKSSWGKVQNPQPAILGLQNE